MSELSDKLAELSPALRRKITIGERKHQRHVNTPVSDYLLRTMRHCNAGRTVDAGLWLKDHCAKGGKIFISLAGAFSSFQGGIPLCDLMAHNAIAGISATGANMEESLYRMIANSHYAYIPRYEELTPEEEQELNYKGLRRITDTFLPEEESVRLILPELEEIWREAEENGERLLWHEYFFRLFERKLVHFDGSPSECWLYQAWLKKIPVFVPGFEDSTMGNIFTYYTYGGNHPFLKSHKQKKPVNPDVVLPGISYMHKLAEWYMDATKDTSLAFLQLGGGIAADFPICVVPHLKKDYLADHSIGTQEKAVKAWAGFIEIHSSPMSFGSYSGAGGKEKITWSKVNPKSYRMQIFGDFTTHFPLLAALVLGE